MSGIGKTKDCARNAIDVLTYFFYRISPQKPDSNRYCGLQLREDNCHRCDGAFEISDYTNKTNKISSVSKARRFWNHFIFFLIIKRATII